ncbi:SapC family protein [uncultured Sphingomonas sp.]|uniref:SapC family protein n=1 Tax=uncultured Sphingomonas sp. TaxID=158754 RepID=UPI0025D5D46F|nr:SapC family protein [uncultured Sphingomonas sp.]
MTGIVPLSALAHARLRFDRRAAGATRRFARIGLSEIAYAAADMPLCLAKDGQTGRFNLIALMSLVEPANLFVFGGGFQATYVPRAALLGGFRLDARGATGLAVDPTDPSLGENGEALFDGDYPAPLLANVAQGLERLVADISAAQALVDDWAEYRLIRPLALSLTRDDGTVHDLAGLYTIDEAAMEALPDADVLALHRADRLAPAAILTASLAQVERLRQLHNVRFAPAIMEYTLD